MDHLAGLHLVDLLRFYPSLHHHVIGLRQDEHDGFARTNHTTNGVHGELLDAAGDGSLDHHALKPRCRGELAFLVLSHLAFNLTELGHGLQ